MAHPRLTTHDPHMGYFGILAAETRNKIFAFAFETPAGAGPISLDAQVDCQDHSLTFSRNDRYMATLQPHLKGYLPLQQASKQLALETRAIFYQVNTIRLRTGCHFLLEDDDSVSSPSGIDSELPNFAFHTLRYIRNLEFVFQVPDKNLRRYQRWSFQGPCDIHTFSITIHAEIKEEKWVVEWTGGDKETYEVQNYKEGASEVMEIPDRVEWLISGVEIDGGISEQLLKRIWEVFQSVVVLESRYG